MKGMHRMLYSLLAGVLLLGSGMASVSHANTGVSPSTCLLPMSGTIHTQWDTLITNCFQSAFQKSEQLMNEAYAEIQGLQTKEAQLKEQIKKTSSKTKIKTMEQQVATYRTQMNVLNRAVLDHHIKNAYASGQFQLIREGIYAFSAKNPTVTGDALIMALKIEYEKARGFANQMSNRNDWLSLVIKDKRSLESGIPLSLWFEVQTLERDVMNASMIEDQDYTVVVQKFSKERLYGLDDVISTYVDAKGLWIQKTKHGYQLYRIDEKTKKKNVVVDVIEKLDDQQSGIVHVSIKQADYRIMWKHTYANGKSHGTMHYAVISHNGDYASIGEVYFDQDRISKRVDLLNP